MSDLRTRYISAIEYLYALCGYLNVRYFGGELSRPVIVMVAEDKKSGFTTKGVWKESEGELNSPELSIPASLLKENEQAIAERVLHLLCHRYAKESDLKETTRYGKYHNRVFKRIAETHGLTVTMAEKTGWSETKLSDENCLSGFNIPKPDIYRESEIVPKRIRGTGARKYSCSLCGKSVRATSEVRVPLGTTYEQLDKTKAPIKAGYTCIGWSNEENGEVATGTLRYSDSSGVLYIQVYPMYAKEAPAETAKYTVTFKDGEKVLYTLSVESGKAVNLSEYPEINESAAKTGYTFKGWAARIDGAVIAKNGYLPNITADTTLYAVYKKTSGIDSPSDNPSDTPSDKPSDNPDAPADDKPSDTDKPADKPSDGAGDNITLDKSDVKKYVGKGSAVGGYFPKTFEWGENDKTYDLGFFALYYYSTILSTDVRAKSEVKTIKIKDELNARLKDDNYVARYEDFEKVLGIYREGKTVIKVNYLAMTGFNTYETRTYETDISAYLVPNENMVKERVLTAFGAEETGIAAFNAVYTPTSLFVMESGEYGSAEVFGSRIIRAATGLCSDYDGGEIPEELTVTVIYSEYSYKDFCLQIKNNNKDMPNSLYLDFYPAETKTLDGYVTLVFDYEKIFTLFGTTFNWSGYPADFTVNIPEEYSDKVKISEEKTGRKGVDPDGKEFDYNKLTVKVKESEQTELFGIPITGTANITKPVELNVTLVYETLDENLKTTEKSVSLGKRFDNTFGTLSAEMKSRNGAYASFVYDGISPEVLGGTEYMKVAGVKYTVNYKEQTATFRIEYGFNTVFAFRIGEKISAVRLAKSCTAEELFIPIPDGFRIKKIYGDNTGRAVMKENT